MIPLMSHVEYAPVRKRGERQIDRQTDRQTDAKPLHYAYS